MASTGMSKKHQRILNKHSRFLREQLEADRVMFDLLSAEILEQEHIADIKAKPTKYKRAEELLAILPGRGQKAFQELLKSLDEKQPHLSKLLREEEEKETLLEYTDMHKGEEMSHVKKIEKTAAVHSLDFGSSVQASSEEEGCTGSARPTTITSSVPLTRGLITESEFSANTTTPWEQFHGNPQADNEDLASEMSTRLSEFSDQSEEFTTASESSSRTPELTEQSSDDLQPPDEGSETESCMAGSDRTDDGRGYRDEGDGPFSGLFKRSKKRGYDLIDKAIGENLHFEKYSTIPTSYAPGLEIGSFYDMGADEEGKRGKVLIINNKDFTVLPYKYYPRTGTDIDAYTMEQLFTQLQYEVIVEKDQTVNQMRDLMHKHTIDTDHSKYTSFVFVVLSHGLEGKVWGTDGEIDIKELAMKARDTDSLVGKPKLFFIQACQGTEFMKGRDVLDGPGRLLCALPGVPEKKEQIQLPAEADFLYAYSTVPGYYSWRNIDNGSWFIQDVVKIFFKHAMHMDIVKMLTRVNAAMSTRRSDHNQTMQISTIISNLRKELYFFPELMNVHPVQTQHFGSQPAVGQDCVDSKVSSDDMASEPEESDSQSSAGDFKEEEQSGWLPRWCTVM